MIPKDTCLLWMWKAWALLREWKSDKSRALGSGHTTSGWFAALLCAHGSAVTDTIPWPSGCGLNVSPRADQSPVWWSHVADQRPVGWGCVPPRLCSHLVQLTARGSLPRSWGSHLSLVSSALGSVGSWISWRTLVLYSWLGMDFINNSSPMRMRTCSELVNPGSPLMSLTLSEPCRWPQGAQGYLCQGWCVFSLCPGDRRAEEAQELGIFTEHWAVCHWVPKGRGIESRSWWQEVTQEAAFAGSEGVEAPPPPPISHRT